MHLKDLTLRISNAGARIATPHYDVRAGLAYRLLYKWLYIDAPTAQESVCHQLERSDVHIDASATDEFLKVRVQVRVLRGLRGCHRLPAEQIA
jgi:hypothetical protein